MPGATTSPPASMVSAASSLVVPISTMRPSRTPTSAGRAGAPVPSTTEPPLITQSSMRRPYRSRTGVSTPAYSRFRHAGSLGAGALGGVEGFAAGGLGGGAGGALVGCGGPALGLLGLALLEDTGAL